MTNFLTRGKKYKIVFKINLLYRIYSSNTKLRHDKIVYRPVCLRFKKTDFYSIFFIKNLTKNFKNKVSNKVSLNSLS